MKRHLVVLLSIAFLAGCASVSSSSLPARITEENVKTFLVGTWNGYVGQNDWPIPHGDITLQIFEVRKSQEVWTVNAVVNGRSLESISLFIQNGSVRLQMMSHGGGLFVLDTHGSGYLTGTLTYGRGRWDPHHLALKKISS